MYNIYYIIFFYFSLLSIQTCNIKNKKYFIVLKLPLKHKRRSYSLIIWFEKSTHEIYETKKIKKSKNEKDVAVGTGSFFNQVQEKQIVKLLLKVVCSSHP